MTIEEFKMNIHDTGLETKTLEDVLTCFIIDDTYYNPRERQLKSDKKVNYGDIRLDRNYLVSQEIIIFKKIIQKLCEKHFETVIIDDLSLKAVVTEVKIKALMRLDDDSLKKAFDRSDISIWKKFINMGIDDAMHVICQMAILDDYAGSRTHDLFEKHHQKIETSKISVPYTKRIYLNIPLNNLGVDFLTLFKLKCIEKGIPSMMKGFGSSPDEKDKLDTTIIYSNDFYLMDHISILEEIIQSRKDMVSNFGTPVVSGGRVISSDGNCYYNVAAGLLANHTGNDFYGKIFLIAFSILCLKYCFNKNISNRDIIEMIGKTTSDTKKFIYKNNGRDLCKMMKAKIERGELSINQLIVEYRDIIKIVASYLKFNDFSHTEVPLYQDEMFIKFMNNDAQEVLDEKERYLYHTEELIDEVLDLYIKGDFSYIKLIENYLTRIRSVYDKFRYYAVREKGFVMSDRFKEVHGIFNQLIGKYGLIEISSLSEIEKREYYPKIQEGIIEYINNKMSRL